jgi:hypothetical protein
MESALGKVLFIDEAYRLNPKLGGSFMQEALDEIVQMLTEPKFRGKMVVILAGYEADIEELMQVNPGLRSRFSQKLHFRNFNLEDACTIMHQHLAKHELILSKEAEEALPILTKQLVDKKDFGNGRDLDTWAKRIYRQWASLGKDEVSRQDMETSLQKMLDDSKTENKLPQRYQVPTEQTASQSSKPPSIQTKISTAIKEEKIKEEEQEPEVIDTGKTGISDADMKLLNKVAEDMNLMGTEDDPDRLVRELINADTSSETVQQYVKKIALLSNRKTEEALALVKQLQKETTEVLQQIQESKRITLTKKKREVWKCQACGRFVPQCTFMPYKAYEEDV